MVRSFGVKSWQNSLKIINGSVIVFIAVIGFGRPSLGPWQADAWPLWLVRFGKFNGEQMLSKCQVCVLFQIELEAPKALNI